MSKVPAHLDPKKSFIRDDMSAEEWSQRHALYFDPLATPGSRDFDQTIQADLADSDINTIVARHTASGVAPGARALPEYGDFTGVVDYQSSLNALISAQDSFDTLPAKVRDRFQNDPGLLWHFLQDDSNRDEAVKLGLINPPPVEPPPQRVEIVNPPPTPIESAIADSKAK